MNKMKQNCIHRRYNDKCPWEIIAHCFERNSVFIKDTFCLPSILPINLVFEKGDYYLILTYNVKPWCTHFN